MIVGANVVKSQKDLSPGPNVVRSQKNLPSGDENAVTLLAFWLTKRNRIQKLLSLYKYNLMKDGKTSSNSSGMNV